MKEKLEGVGGFANTAGVISIIIAVILLFYAQPVPWIAILGLVLFAALCFLIATIIGRYRWSRLTEEERKTEEEIEKNIREHDYSYYCTNSINKSIYDKMDEMIAQAENEETKQMLIKQKEQFLQEDINKIIERRKGL